MKHLQLLIKPASSLCNLRCAYCFYKDEAEHREIASHGIMSEETMECLIRKALQAAEESCTFGFQGGEPLLAGLDFYKAFVECAEKYRPPGLKVQYTIQTNGLLLDEEWMDFLEEHPFLLGVSLDGTMELHDRNRVDEKKNPTAARVLKVLRELKKREIPFNILCVLTRQGARHVEAIYEFFRKQGFLWQQYIPCLDPLEEPRGQRPWSLKPKDYGEALKKLFDLWFSDLQQGIPVSIRQFDNWYRVLSGGLPEACSMYGRCTMQNVIEADGSIYPCDFYALDEFYMGNIREEEFEELHRKALSKEAEFFKEAEKRDDNCPKCRWYPLCRGGCRRDLYEEGNRTHHYYCEAYREFFAYAIHRLEWLVSRSEGGLI